MYVAIVTFIYQYSSIILAPVGAASSFAPGEDGYHGPLHADNDEVVMTSLQIALSREVFGWPIYTIVIAAGQMLSATSFQITLLSGQNWQTDLQLYVLGGVFLAASAVWYTLFRFKPSVYVLSAPWIFFGLAFILIGLPSVATALHPAHDAITSAATWCYAIGSAAAFLFFGLNFGEEAVSLPILSTAHILISPRVGRCDGSLDNEGVHRARLSADLGRRVVVLGQFAQRHCSWQYHALVDCPHRMAVGGD